VRHPSSTRPTLPALAVALGAAVMAAACSSPPQTAPVARQAAPAAASQDRESVTGSRIPRKSTDQMVHTIDAAGAREMDRAKPPNPGPRIQ
jgi:hypothetical protein